LKCILNNRFYYVSNSTEDTLIKRITKINRMDIVHLIEIQMHKSIQEQTSRTYAEIERTLDHSEGRTMQLAYSWFAYI